jgi:hypothetical protein
MHREKSPSDIKKMLDFALMWNYVNGIKDVLESDEVRTLEFVLLGSVTVYSFAQVIEYDPTWNADLFEKALIHNRPAFVDYFLRRQYDVLETTGYMGMKSNRAATTDHNTTAPMPVPASSVKAAVGRHALQPGANEHRSSISNDIIEYERSDEANIRAMYARKFIVTQLYRTSKYRMKVISLASMMRMLHYSAPSLS